MVYNTVSPAPRFCDLTVDYSLGFVAQFHRRALAGGALAASLSSQRQPVGFISAIYYMCDQTPPEYLCSEGYLRYRGIQAWPPGLGFEFAVMLE